MPLGIIHRKGLGKTRHIQIGLLWIQQVSAEKRLTFGKVFGKLNPADLFTKYLDNSTIEQHVARLNYMFTEGRASDAPTFHNVSISIDECEFLGQWRQWEWLATINHTAQNNDNKTHVKENKELCRGDINVCAFKLGNARPRFKREPFAQIGYINNVEARNGRGDK